MERHARGSARRTEAWRHFLEGTRARSRNNDGKNVPDTTTSFKTVACLNVTLAHAKIAQFWWLAVAPIVDV
jgi:hypothetical protein